MNATRTRLLEYLKDMSGFEIKKIEIGGPLPKELNSEILWNLWDIGLKFGQEIPKGFGFKITFGNIGLIMEFHGFLENGEGGKDGFVVSKPSGAKLAFVESPVLLELKNGVGLMWSNKIEIPDVLACIAEVDRIATKVGEMENGIRIARLFPISKTMLN